MHTDTGHLAQPSVLHWSAPEGAAVSYQCQQLVQLNTQIK